MKIAVLGSGAFGTALAISLSHVGKDVTLWGRDAQAIDEMKQKRVNRRYLPKAIFPKNLHVTSDSDHALAAETLLFAVPMQQLATIVQHYSPQLSGKNVIACCKGLDIKTGVGPTALIEKHAEGSRAGILSGPSFARDLGAHLPTALTLSCRDQAVGRLLQNALSSHILRLYTNEDMIGVELGGALKNVVAIGSGICIGAGLGHSARAALMTRGFRDMCKVATELGAKIETLTGLSGLGDLSLTCMSDLSRNFRYGEALGQGNDFDAHITVEGVSTAEALQHHEALKHLEMPIFRAIANVAHGRCTIKEATKVLMTRPQGEE